MNRTKTIYFLSAIVLIIGCYALNLSYSLFVQTEEKEVVSSIVPKIDIALSQIDTPPSTLSDTDVSNTTSYVLVEAGKEYIVKQTIINNSTIPINYGLNTNLPDNVSLATHESIPNNLPYGLYNEDEELDTSLQPNTSKDVYLIVSNLDGEEDIAITFSLDYSYASLTKDASISNIVNSKEVEISSNGFPYSDKPNTLSYHIMNNFVNSEIYSNDNANSNDFELENVFLNEELKKELPLTGGSFSVPTPTSFTDIETNEVGLYATEDDYGTSYYFRGASSSNYVYFAGITWRIVRINGDGSVRLIFNNLLREYCYKYDHEGLCKEPVVLMTQFSIGVNDNGGVGYMNGTEKEGILSTSYDIAHKNLYSSQLKIAVDTFYETFLTNYQDYLSDILFCGDKTLSRGSGFGDETAYYSAYDRLLKNSNATPTLECANNSNVQLTEEQLSYSRYTSIIDMSSTTSKGVLVNNNLTYPIGLLSGDELVFAGAFKDKNNTSYYLYDSYDENLSDSYFAWWTMTPSFYDETAFLLGAVGIPSLFNYDAEAIIRPVINLRSDVLVDNGNGSSGTPYTVKLPTE